MIQYQAQSGRFNAWCDSPFIAINRDQFPMEDGLPGQKPNGKTCLVPVVPAVAGTHVYVNVHPIQYKATSTFDARCDSPMFPVDPAKFPAGASAGSCLTPVIPG